MVGDETSFNKLLHQLQADFYRAAFYQHEPVRRQICMYIATPPSFGAGKIPCFPASLAEQHASHCDLSRLVGIFTSALDEAGGDFPSLSTLLAAPLGKIEFPCEHTYDDFLWCTKVEYGRFGGCSGKVFVNVRMPNDGFVYLPAQSSPLAPHIDPSQPTVTRHGGIELWHEVDASTLPTQLEPFVVYFLNWLCGRQHTSQEPLPDTIPTCTVQAWYNSEANRMDIELSAPTPDGRECVWSLSFEPWSPVIKSKRPGVFGAADLIKFHAAQAAKMKK